MTDPERASRQAVQFAEQGQAATAELVRTMSETWANAMRTATGVGSATPSVPAPAELIDRSFDFAVQMIEAQRSFAHQLLAAGTPVAQAMGQVTDSVVDRTRQASSRSSGA